MLVREVTTRKIRRVGLPLKRTGRLEVGGDGDLDIEIDTETENAPRHRDIYIYISLATAARSTNVFFFIIPKTLHAKTNIDAQSYLGLLSRYPHYIKYKTEDPAFGWQLCERSQAGAYSGFEW